MSKIEPASGQSSQPVQASTRRTFYTAFIYGIWGAITAALAIPAGIYLLLPPAIRKESEWIDASDIDSIPTGVPTEISFQHKRVDGWKVSSEKTTAWIVREDHDQVTAFAPQCTHLGCAYHWEQRNHSFVCPCHASEFSIEGQVLGGPAPRPLDRYEVKVEAGRIKIGSLNRMRELIDWLEQRTGIETAVKSFLYEEIPASSGWPQILGAMALFFFLVQGVTGILLAFNYAPTPGEAYNSLRYIMTEVMGGRLIRGLHHWGASMMIIVVVLHMLQVFLFGAYKKPREATWMMGVILLLITLAFGLTGYLLPWDNRAYWGTVVTTRIAAGAPGAGPYLVRLLGGEGVGVVTFARFFAAHVVLLPPITLLLIAIHVYLVRKHGVAPAPDDTAPKQKFYPRQVFKDTVGFAVAFIILFLLAAFADVPLEKLADPTDTHYIPRPEWYFLFLFQLLKAFKGPLEVVGSTLLPGLAILILFCIPLIDREPMVRLGKRVFAMAFAALALVGWGGLTAEAIMTTPPNPGGRSPGFNTFELSDWQKLTPEELSGLTFFRSENCVACHLGPGKKGVGPDLTQMPEGHRNVAWMVKHFKAPAEVTPGSAMPPVRLRDSELNALSLFVLKFTPENEAELLAAPQEAVKGANIYRESHCSACHQLQGAGMKIGPPLDSVGDRRNRAWLEQHFKDPKSLSPNSRMPAFKFDDDQMDAICRYLLQMP